MANKIHKVDDTFVISDDGVITLNDIENKSARS